MTTFNSGGARSESLLRMPSIHSSTLGPASRAAHGTAEGDGSCFYVTLLTGDIRDSAMGPFLHVFEPFGVDVLPPEDYDW